MRSPKQRLTEPSREHWINAAKMAAALENVSFKEIILGERRHAIARARWRAFKAVLDTDKRASIAGLARVSGFDHTTILHGLGRLSGLSRSAMISCGRASGRRPCAVLEAAE